MANRVSREVGGPEITTGQITTPDIEVQQIIDAFNEIQGEAFEKGDWFFANDSFTMTSTAGSRTLIMSAVTNLNFMKPLRKVRDTTNNRHLKELTPRLWDSRTWSTNTGTPTAYRRFGFATSNAGLMIAKIHLDPRPTVSTISYEIEYPTILTDLTSPSGRSPFPDTLLLNGVLSRMVHYDGFDAKPFKDKYDEMLDTLITNEDTGTEHVGGGAADDETSRQMQLPADYPGYE